MRRRLLNVLTVVSLLLCAAVCVLWVRSVTVSDGLALRAPHGTLVWALSRNNAFEPLPDHGRQSRGSGSVTFAA